MERLKRAMEKLHCRSYPRSYHGRSSGIRSGMYRDVSSSGMYRDGSSSGMSKDRDSYSSDVYRDGGSSGMFIDD